MSEVWLVCGGRNYTNEAMVFVVLDKLCEARGKPRLVVHGDCRGADHIAKRWAQTRSIPQMPVPADWSVFDRRAGPKRNQEMIDEYHPDLVVAFRGGTGTADMVSRARAANIEVLGTP